MLERGARSFLFLGRSGTDKRAAQDTVNELRDGGASVQLVRGDVCCREDVRRAFTEPKIRIGGVIQAAMALKVSVKHFIRYLAIFILTLTFSRQHSSPKYLAGIG